MPDITMCRDVTCPLKNKCQRFISISNEKYQCYFTLSPLHLDAESGAASCEYYWEVME